MRNTIASTKVLLKHSSVLCYCVVVVEIVTLSPDLCILGLCKTMFRALDHRTFYSLFSSIFTLKHVFEHLIFPRQVSGFPAFKRIELLELFLLADPLVSGRLGNIVGTHPVSYPKMPTGRLPMTHQLAK